MTITHECPHENITCAYSAPCAECILHEERQEEHQEEQILQHVKDCTADGFCYICQCL
ncbi:hypothetical protein NPS70_16250 [Streptomyces sp. C10-9-1]|uniref:hypothetical protein n=1 Tax=Streptomyces sp. C10-9-1 TaxID=1859285 RepID=UPI002112D12F|nr:hypothetical protein [Streptomyces sp. C10-9-1]MCQ6554738.1 hypothetical protein [Streptomyces sp. C10-9-1]